MHNFLIITPLFAFGLSLVLAIFVLYRDHRNNINRLFSIFLISMALWGFFTYGLRSSSNTDTALIWDKALVSIVVLCGVTFLHFSIIRTRIKLTKWLIPIAYIVLLVVIGLLPSQLIVKGIAEDQYGYYPVGGLLIPIIALASYTFFIIGLSNFIRAYRASSSYEERNSYLYIIVGVCFFLFLGVIDLASVFGVPLPPIAILGNIIFSILASIALLKFKLIDMHVVFRRGVAYLLLMVVIGLVLLAFDLTGLSMPFWGYLLLLVAVILAFPRLWVRIQRLVDRWFFGERFDYMEALVDFSRESHEIGDLNYLGRSLTGLIYKALQASSVRLLLPSNSGDFTVQASEVDVSSQITLKKYSPIVLWLEDNKDILRRQDLDVVPLLQSLSSSIANEIKRIKAELFVPMFSRDNKLVGVIIVGEKANQQPYSFRDEYLMQIVINHMAVELENAHLYQTEKGQREELAARDLQLEEYSVNLEQLVEKRTLELRDTQDKLAISAKLAAIGQLASGVAHELRNPLAVINNAAYYLKMVLGDADEKVKRHLDMMEKEVIRSSNVIEGLLDLARSKEPVLSDVVLNTVIEEVISSIDIPENIKVELGQCDTEVTAAIDVNQVERVFSNLATNAIQAMSKGGTLTIGCRRQKDYAVIEFRDTGRGIPPENLKRIFESMFTTKSDMGNIGIGLAISKTIIEAHKGTIDVQSEVGKGTTFTVSLPIIDSDKSE